MPRRKPREGRVDRIRHERPADVTRKHGRVEFQNPYPWMSQVEAMVHLDLERRHVPFSWRYFDGESLNLTTLVPGFAPEFTLREYKIVILIAGQFWGTLPGVIDMNALAASLLVADGWTVVTLFEAEIRAGVTGLIDRKLPALSHPSIIGPPRPNPYGNVDLMSSRRKQLQGQGLRRKVFKTEGDTRVGKRRVRIRPAGDFGRVRKPRSR